jgi:hypothetical protein
MEDSKQNRADTINLVHGKCVHAGGWLRMAVAKGDSACASTKHGRTREGDVARSHDRWGMNEASSSKPHPWVALIQGP